MWEQEDEDEVPMWIKLLEAELKYKATRHRVFQEAMWGLLYGLAFAWICGLVYAIVLLIDWIRG